MRGFHSHNNLCTKKNHSHIQNFNEKYAQNLSHRCKTNIVSVCTTL